MLTSIQDIVDFSSGTFAINVPSLNVAYWLVKIFEERRRPLILQLSERLYVREGAYFVNVLSEIARQSKAKVALHLDHCGDIDLCKSAIGAGINSVLFDGSHLDLIENQKLTENLVVWAKKKGAFVEGEISPILGQEDGKKVNAQRLVTVDESVSFIRKTGVFSFSPFFGNSHGLYHAPVNQYDTEFLKHLRDQSSVPLVIHGGSGLPSDVIRTIRSIGVGKVNISTEIKKVLQNHKHGDWDPFKSDQILYQSFVDCIEELFKKWST